ncbi:MAG TPA: hypothetical protein DCW90_13335 [Lachnospiraceae bacterium]|nr:hypothetical protein [Lachnospiraceae bacterium]
MPNKEIHSRIKHKRDTHENWTAANPVILSNELIFVDVDSETKIKIGDGVTAYKELPFILEVEQGVEIVEANSEDGVAYIATSKTIKELKNGTMLVAIIKTAATTQTPTLNLNNLGDVNLMAINVNTGSGVKFRKTSDLSENKAIKLFYNGSEWIAINVLGSALAISNGGTGATTAALARFMLGLGNTNGPVPIANGGTGTTTAARALTNLGAAAAKHTHKSSDIEDLETATQSYVNTAIDNLDTITVEKGGTGATTAQEALSNLGAAAETHNHSATDIKTGTLPISRGGTGATTAALARFMLGLGNTTGAVPIANGGTNATTAARALNNLGGLSISGGRMTGELVLAADPTQDLGAATKQYVDNTIGDINTILDAINGEVI